MSATLTPDEQAQLMQTVEMFESIAVANPHDYQSMEILKEAYLKLGRDQDLLDTSKRIAEAYVEMGQISSAILEYETLLQRFPENTELISALAEIDSQSNNGLETLNQSEIAPAPEVGSIRSAASTQHLDDGRDAMHKLFVDGKHISDTEFCLCWPDVDNTEDGSYAKTFVENLTEKNMMSLEKAVQLVVERTRVCYIPLEMYDIQIDTTRSYDAEICRRWTILPMDQIGPTVIVATTNPFNVRAMHELQQCQEGRIQWYLAAAADITRELKKAFRS